MQQSTSNIYLSSKPHYEILDGLRGVASIMVVMFHIMEAHSANHYDQIINHGYLAVDFFFVLSGFVVGYAYDDRWGKMSFANFCKRRLIRLQPMIVLGMVVGALLFYFAAGDTFEFIAGTPLWKMLLVMVVGCTLIPLTPGMDIRGWREMHPLNGPAWTLFFEYIANILYALVLRRLSKRALSIVAFLAACVTVHYLLTGSGDVVGGWSLDGTQLRIGFTRLAYPFVAGLLLSRLGHLRYIKNAFLWCSLLIIVILSIPRVGSIEQNWMNGIYESFCIIILFPLIVYLGAGGKITGKWSLKGCNFLGGISYPLYISHYPIIYIYTAWVRDNGLSFTESFWGAVITFVSSVALAYIYYRFYDIPVRTWLQKRFLQHKSIQ